MTPTPTIHGESMNIPKGMICKVAIQCRFPATGEIGDWLYSGANINDPAFVRSPLFHNIIKLADWARANGFKGYGDYYVYEPKTTSFTR